MDGIILIAQQLIKACLPKNTPLQKEIKALKMHIQTLDNKIATTQLAED